jgi:hypothetical protein
VRSEAERAQLDPVVPNVKVCPCVSLLLGEFFPPSPTQRPYRTSNAANTIGIHVNMSTLRSLPDLIPALLELARKYNLLFIPFTFYQNDVAIMETLVKWLPNATMSAARDPVSIFTTIGGLRAFICSSLHASIFAYAQNVPVLAYPTDPKIRDFWEERKYPSALYSDSGELLAGVERLLHDPPDCSSSCSQDTVRVRAHLDELVSIVKCARVCKPLHMTGSHPTDRERAYYESLLGYVSFLGHEYANQIDLRMQLNELLNSRSSTVTRLFRRVRRRLRLLGMRLRRFLR